MGAIRDLVKATTRQTVASESLSADWRLRAYFLGQVEFEEILSLQRRLAYDVAGGDSPCLILCEHAPILTVGRHGSRSHFLFDEADLPDRRWRIRWVNRGGGCWLQMPGQMAIYPILPLRRMELPIRHFVSRLQQTIIDTLADFTVTAEVRSGSADIWVGDRPAACIGAAVRQWVSYFGAVLNVNPDLPLCRLVRTGNGHAPMTSLERERRGPVRPSHVRQCFLENFARHFEFTDHSLFMEHPLLLPRRKAQVHALVAVG